MIVKVFSSSQWLNASKSLLEGDIITDLKLWKTPTTRTQEWGKQTSVYGTLSSVKMGVGSDMGVIFRHHSVLTVHRSISFQSKTKYICMHKKQRNLKSCRGVLLNTWPVSQRPVFTGVWTSSVSRVTFSWTAELIRVCLSARERWSVSPYGSLAFSPSSQEVWQHTFVPTHTHRVEKYKRKGFRKYKHEAQQAIITWSLILVLFTKICTRTHAQLITGSHSWFGWNSIEQSFRFHLFCMRIVMFWIKT